MYEEKRAAEELHRGAAVAAADKGISADASNTKKA
jgi:hypothetical protein